MSVERCVAYLSAQDGQPARRCKAKPLAGAQFCGTHSGVTATGLSHARKTLAKYGTPKHVDPIYGYLQLVYEAQGNVEFLREKINELQRMVVPGRATREEVSSWVQLYDQERDRLQKYLADGVRIGLEERQIRFMEQQKTAIVNILQEMLNVEGLPDDVRSQQKSIALEKLRGFSSQPDVSHSPFSGSRKVAA